MLVPEKLLPARSLTVPEEKTTKYWVPLARSFVGSMVSVLPDRVTRVLVAALKDSTSVPVAEPLRISMVPVPRAIASEKVSTMLLPIAAAVAPSAGLKVNTVGAVVSLTVVKS